MITQFRVKNYKALRDVTLNLTPIHVLIGPNDTGKTSLLEALAALCRSVDTEPPESFTGRWEGRELIWQGSQMDDGAVTLSVTVDREGLTYTLAYSFGRRGRRVGVSEETIQLPRLPAIREAPSLPDHPSLVLQVVHGGVPVDDDTATLCKTLHEELSGVTLYRWVPEFLSVPVAPYERERATTEPSGFGLALCLDDILGDDRRRFDDLEERFRKIFPEIAQIKLRPEPGFKARRAAGVRVPILEASQGKGLHFKLSNGAIVPASQMSDGALLVLAYLAILKSPEPPRVLLVEEPENGIHPKRLQEVLSILRELIAEQKHTQVLMTTHSPYVLDLFDPEEVTLCTKGDDGAVRVHRLSESKAVREQIDTFTLGEIWTAEGDEALTKRADDAGEAAP